MASKPAHPVGPVPMGPVRARVLALVARVPCGRVTTPECIASDLGVPPPLVMTVLGKLSEDERDIVPWHRVVASGGALGRGPWRERQFARLLREGVLVSPAGIVQDMARCLITDLSRDPGAPSAKEAPPPSKGRSRGMKDRPGP